MTEEPQRRPPKFGGGPHGLGDPDDKFLRKTESDILIPKRVREISRREYCKEFVEAFVACCQENRFSFSSACKQQNMDQIKCLEKYFYDEELRERATKEYLEERSEYRRTGIPKKEREKQNTRVRTFH